MQTALRPQFWALGPRRIIPSASLSSRRSASTYGSDSKKGSDKKNLYVSIGPCITGKNYEVKNNFKQRFVKKDKKSIKFFKNKKNKTYFCLNKYVYNQLKQFGIKNIELINKDTYEKKNNLFSARRSAHNDEVDYGRNISIIMIK